ncbi:cysteine--tRNA ligase [Sinimarinibacterium sp. NLF-5-8]|uniref:cysteine--tRNA ligase n=1 Tax=Sinimarinibacterium sp. NLF-5-8 TaxID=2698684 RepID=UPI00137BD40B|nr:cysteine--tRNA ligase [Sinimarinibacterium sp. NLF-5-8]QHS09516.1 cysteine--tRNA ligase [Sinimarinibacterium sp. NLF-5-8]
MQLHNTLTGTKQPFVPLDPQRVTMYVCGPTVYSYAHIGNARPAVVFDVLSRLLRRNYPQVVYVRNITDIDDKINAAAAKEGVDISVITNRYAAIYHDDMAALGVLPPDHAPRVTQHLPQIIQMIERLIENGHAYAAEGHVLFHTLSFKDYGQLSGRDEQSLMAGARIEVAPYKKHAGDFVLWKPSSADQPGWDSPWGRGRPGWHIECSAMAEALLGETIDIHGGGHDLIFPHHENEIAQSTCAHGGKPFARYWLHNGFLNVDSQKMSKSIGNVLLVHELLKHMPGEVIRLVLLTGHYRQPVDWNDEVVAEARKKLDRLYGALRELEDVQPAANVSAPEGFVRALEDDLNTPMALAELFELARAANKARDAAEKAQIKAQMLDAGQLLGLLQQNPAAWFSHAPAADDAPTAEQIEALLAERLRARQNRQWGESDRIRDDLKARGVLVEDGKDGQRWRYA